MAKSMKLGGGGRFAKLEKKLSARPGVTDPAALAASIGRKKYGAKKFAMLSHMPAGATLSPQGDLGAQRQMEADAQKGFKNAGRVVKTAGMFGSLDGYSAARDKALG